ncbi:MAG: ACT domain-containing protein [Pseudomonadota bacterium]
MDHRIEIDFHASEGAILRLVGLVERRGFEVLGMTLPHMDATQPAHMGLTVRPRDDSRRLAVLEAQLRRIHGVSDVRHGAANDPDLRYEAAS